MREYRLLFFMQYDKEILRVLAEAGNEGLSVRKISRHVYNACNSLFNPIEQEEVHRYVQLYLLKNCKTVGSIFEKTRKGVYRLNKANQTTQRHLLLFRDEEEIAEEKPVEDQSLSLF
ncbi:hypothetical protein JCM17724A_21430 [Prevotella fusca JCM 17724]